MMSPLSVWLNAIVLVQGLVHGVAMSADQFDFDVQVVGAGSVPVEGPIPLRVGLTFNGEGSVELLVTEDGLPDLSFGVPEGWQLTAPRPRIAPIRPPVVVLEKGQSIERTVYLHDFFSEIKPGEVELPIALRVWPAAGDQSLPIATLQKTVSLNISGENLKLFQQRLRDLVTRLESEKSASVRLELYRSTLNLTGEEVISILLTALGDQQVMGFHASARNRLLELCDRYNSWQGVVRYLASSGTRYDGSFFSFWRQKEIVLPDELKEELRTAHSLWTRLFYIEAYHDKEDVTGIRDTLAQEVSDIASRIEDLGGEKEQ